MVATRVAAVDDSGSAAIEGRDIPSPDAGEILLRLRMCGICGTDLYKFRSQSVAEGTVLGHEITGSVEAVGRGVDQFRTGDRVVVPHHVACGECELCLKGSDTLCPTFRENLLEPGGFSEFVLVRERAVRLAAWKIPAHVTDEAALFLEPAACVLRGIRRAGLLDWPESIRARVAIIGAGGMGLLHLLVLRAVRPQTDITVIDVREDRVMTAKSLGADHALRPNQVASGLGAVASGGVDVVFDTVGGAHRLREALEMTREGGSVVLFAHAQPEETADFELNAFFKGERRVIATYSGSLADQREIFSLIESGKLDAAPIVTHRVPLSDFAHGLELAFSQEAVKVAVVPDQAVQP